MEVIDCSEKEYLNIFSDTYHVFNSAKFNTLNIAKCNQIKFLLFYEGKYRLGLIAGVKENWLYTPFSAPFGSFSFLDEHLRINYIEDSIDALEIYSKKNNFKGITHQLPPNFYNEYFLSKLINVFYRKNYKISNLDLDFYFEVNKIGDDYINSIEYNAKKNLKTALKNNYSFHKIKSTEEINAIYEIIKENRKFRNKPLNMSFEDIIKTQQTIEMDFFLVKLNQIDVASAIIFHVNRFTNYIPFWADLPEYSKYRPMNYLISNLIEFYYKKIDYIHVGISTENSIPNYGLCEFKENVGCKLIPKYTFTKEF